MKHAVAIAEMMQARASLAGLINQPVKDGARRRWCGLGDLHRLTIGSYFDTGLRGRRLVHDARARWGLEPTLTAATGECHRDQADPHRGRKPARCDRG